MFCSILYSLFESAFVLVVCNSIICRTIRFIQFWMFFHFMLLFSFCIFLWLFLIVEAYVASVTCSRDDWLKRLRFKCQFYSHCGFCCFHLRMLFHILVSVSNHYSITTTTKWHVQSQSLFAVSWMPNWVASWYAQAHTIRKFQPSHAFLNECWLSLKPLESCLLFWMTYHLRGCHFGDHLPEWWKLWIWSSLQHSLHSRCRRKTDFPSLFREESTQVP